MGRNVKRARENQLVAMLVAYQSAPDSGSALQHWGNDEKQLHPAPGA